MESVVIVGAGPSGLLLALELVRQGISPLILDSREDPDIAGHNNWSKALGIHARSLEIMETIGIVERFIDTALTVKAMNAFNSKGEKVASLGFLQEKYESKYKLIKDLPQYETERILRDEIKKTNTLIHWNSKVTEITESLDSVTIFIQGKKQITAQWLIGCDGGHSIVRKSMNISFEGEDIATSFAMVSCKFESNQPEDEGVISLKNGCVVLPEPEGRMRILIPVTDMQIENMGDTPSLDFFQNFFDKELPVFECKLSDANWLTFFKIRERLAGQYRVGRTFIAGDAAHTHSPAGGQGMNTGFQDGFNLAWKLALVIKGVGHTSLLDSYEAERRPVAAALLKNSGRTTKLAAAQNPIASGVRSAVVQTVPYLTFLHQRLAQAVGMLDITYANSPICKDFATGNWSWINFGQNITKIGARVPYQTIRRLDSSEDELLLMDLCSKDIRHNLLVFCSVSDERLLDDIKRLMNRYLTYIEVHVFFMDEASEGGKIPKKFENLFCDSQHLLASKFGILDTGMILVRPDQHFSFRSAPADISQLSQFLGQIFI